MKAEIIRLLELQDAPISSNITKQGTKRSFEEMQAGELSNNPPAKRPRTDDSPILNMVYKENSPFKKTPGGGESSDGAGPAKLSQTGKKSITDYVNENNVFNSQSNTSQTEKSISDVVKSNNTFKMKITESNIEIPKYEVEGPLAHKIKFSISEIDFSFFSSIKIPSIKIPSIEVSSINYDRLICCLQNTNIEGYFILFDKLICCLQNTNIEGYFILFDRLICCLQNTNIEWFPILYVSFLIIIK